MEGPAGKRDPAASPVRTCVACRRAAPQASLVRFVVRGGAVTVDRHRRMPGRGAYVCSRPGCPESVLARGGSKLARALRYDVERVTVEKQELMQEWNAAVSELRRRGVCT